MAYESIGKLKKYMQKKVDAIATGEKVTFNINAHQLLDEINEMERKAKAWDSLKELLMKEYPSVVHLADVSNGDGERGEMSKHEDILRHMDELDNTNEFSNLLNDLEDE